MKFHAPIAAAALAALAACSTVPPRNADLEAAREAVAQARAHPFATRATAIELERAQRSLSAADSAWNDARDADATRQRAYVARREAEIALAVASQAQNDERIAQAGAERERVRLEARTREAERAAQQARSAQAGASAARSEAATAQEQAAAAQQQAAAAQRQAEEARRRAAEEAERAAALQRDLQSLQARQTERGMVVTLGDVLFASGRSELAPGARRSVERLAEVLRSHPARRVLVEGFTDSVGSEESNLALSQRRADAFAQALVNSGIAADRIEVRAHGEALPVADNATAAGRQQNRRVEVLFSDAQGRFAVAR